MRRFWSDRQGNVAVLFAFAIVPVVGALGAAVDYSLANSYRTDLQKSLDSAALALTKIMPADQTKLNTVGKQYFEASMSADALSKMVPWELTVTPGTGTIVVSVKGTYKPSLVNVLGIESFEIGASATAKWGLGKVEVVLALDNTGSMSGQKIVKLKQGAQKLIDILKNAAREAGDAKIGIVPFGVQVRLDAATYMNSDWLRWDPNVGKCSKSQYLTKNSCTSNNGTWTSATTSNWAGCIADRDKDSNLNYDVKDTAPTSTNNTKFPRTLGCGSLATILPLTDIYTGYATITNKINEMQAVGNTNVTIGAAWGWHLLDNKIPFAEGKPYNTKDVQKYLILMTDGDNTQNRFSTSESQINARTKAACDNIKALPQNTANSPPTPAIKVWSIRLVNGNQTLLKNCATNASMYMNVTDPNQLDSVFGAIGTEIANLHLSK